MNIAGSVALVTGGASGLGLATVRRLHDAGASVVILDLPSSNGTAIAKELGARAAFAAGDVTSPDDVEAALDAARAPSSLAIAVPFDRGRSRMTTDAPASCSRLTVASPSPDAPPVTRATLPAIFIQPPR